MDNPDVIYLHKCNKWGKEKLNDTSAKYLLATPVREAAEELLKALENLCHLWEPALGGDARFFTGSLDEAWTAIAKARSEA